MARLHYTHLQYTRVVVVVVCIRSHNWSARQRHHRLQSVVYTSHRVVLSVGRIRQCVTSFGSHRRNTDLSLKVSVSCYRHRRDLVRCGNGSGETIVVEEAGCRIVGSSTRCALTTEADFQDSLHWLLMSTGSDSCLAERSNTSWLVPSAYVSIGCVKCLLGLVLSVCVTSFADYALARFWLNLCPCDFFVFKFYIARLTGIPDQPRFTIIRSSSWSARANGVAAVMPLSIARANEQLDPRQQLVNTPPPHSTTPGLHPCIGIVIDNLRWKTIQFILVSATTYK